MSRDVQFNYSSYTVILCTNSVTVKYVPIYIHVVNAIKPSKNLEISGKME